MKGLAKYCLGAHTWTHDQECSAQIQARALDFFIVTRVDFILCFSVTIVSCFAMFISALLHALSDSCPFIISSLIPEDMDFVPQVLRHFLSLRFKQHVEGLGTTKCTSLTWVTI